MATGTNFSDRIRRRDKAPDGRRASRRCRAGACSRVRFGIGGNLGGKRRAGAGPVVDIDLLSELVREALTDEAAHDVGRAARREWHDQPDWTDGIGLLGAGRPRCRYHGHCDGEMRGAQ